MILFSDNPDKSYSLVNDWKDLQNFLSNKILDYNTQYS